jgi:hypothetical protein
MASLLYTERKYNSIYYSYAIPAYILMGALVLIGSRTVWAVITQNNYIFWYIIFFVYCGLFYLIIKFIIGKGIVKNDGSYGIGSYAEELVGTKLSALGENYYVIHDISKGFKKENIDHVVVGPTGIFVIESKANKNVMAYYENNIRKTSYLAEKFMKQASRNACWVHDFIYNELGIDKFVYGIVARPFNKDKKTDMYCANRVCIMDGEAVYDHIKKFPDGLYLDEINKINSLLCDVKRDNEKKQSHINITMF